ncbi:Protein of unknown function [Pyronema omphalodes CBS 100304]|uniref:Uncharacterized protein n=1 Tax=Pyronema omphalodes (strain CBS 100304) TaxID=1076935 RepID=U4KUG2_PYROM|nr:Protein of unknown function [Pyronema omphalodes CBS 100304]
MDHRFRYLNEGRELILQAAPSIDSMRSRMIIFHDASHLMKIEEVEKVEDQHQRPPPSCWKQRGQIILTEPVDMYLRASLPRGKIKEYAH